MPAGIEDRVEIVRGDAGERHGGRERSLSGVIALEPARGVGLRVVGIARGVDRRLPALGRGERDIGPRVLEHVIGCRKLLEPETGLVAGIAEIVMRCQDHEDFHTDFSFSGGVSATGP